MNIMVNKELVNECINELNFKFPYSSEEWLEKNMLMENYHKHTTWSNLFQIDSATSIEDFVALSKEYGCQYYFSGEHGYPGEWLYVYDLCKKLNIGFRYSAEVYWVKDIDNVEIEEYEDKNGNIKTREKKDNTNCHMVIVARNYNAIRKLNYIITRANDEGYYYKPRIDLNMLFTLDPEDVYITSACLKGWAYEDATEIWYKVWKHFGDSFFLEYQTHFTDAQKELNKRIHAFAKQVGIKTIIGLDTHYISEEDRIKRDNLLKRKGLNYPEEDGWFMDFPNGVEVYNRMLQQGVIPEKDIIISMMNTHTFNEGCADFSYNTDFKIPIRDEYKELTYEERCNELKKLLMEEYSKEDKDHQSPERLEGIEYEFGQIRDSQTADYFLSNYKLVDLAKSKYGGKLTTTSRGSAASYYSSKLLHFTSMDRFEAEVPIYPERFITKERILASHQMPDIDLNLASQPPFVSAAKELFGENGCFPLLAVGTFGEKSGFKMYADVSGLDPTTANEITKMIDAYNEAVKEADEDDKDSINIEDYIENSEYLKIYNESKPYQGIIEQAKVHACGHLIFNGNPSQKDLVGYGDIRYEIGLIRCSSKTSKKSTLVVNAEGGLLDLYGYVKDDFLIVDVVGIISKLYSSIGREVPSVTELRYMVMNDDKTWDLYAKGITCCLNQCEKPGTTNKVKKYKPQNIKELAAFIAAIRPGFKSQIGTFLDRTVYSTGEKEVDTLLSDSSNFMIYQESIMKVLGFLGVSMKDTYGTIKAISKKKLKGEKKEQLLNKLKDNWLKNFGNLDNFNEIWNIIEDSARYAFNCVSGETVIKRGSSNNKFVPTIEEMYMIMNDKEYAKCTGHLDLHQKYKSQGYGMALSMFEDGRVHRNTIIDINLAKTAQTYKVTTSKGSSIICTAEHKFPTPNGKIMLKELKVGDQLYCLGNSNYENLVTEEPLFKGKSIIFEGEKLSHITNKDCCEICGKKFDGNFELSHKDHDRFNNTPENFQWVCNSCYKTKQFEKGIPTYLDEIVSIEEYKVEKTYNIEMASPAKNFISDTGLITCNSPHALAMANDSLYEAWMKAHHTSTFYEVTLNHYQDKGDKNKVADLLKEATTSFGYKVGKYEYGKDNSQFVVDDKEKIIYPNLGSVKGIGSKAVEDIYNISKLGHIDIVDIYMATFGTGINSTVFRNLVRIGYFKNIGGTKKLLKSVDIIDKWNNRKTISKDEVSELGIQDIISKYGTDVLKSGNISKKYTIFDMNGLLKDICSNIPEENESLAELVKAQIEILGYVELKDDKLSKNYIAVTKLDTTYSPKFEAVCLNNGQVCPMKVSKKKVKGTISFKDIPFEEGDVLLMKKCVKKPKQRNNNGNWEIVPGEYNWWITDYQKM